MTFLVNKKMHPALAARIEASVTGGKPMRGRPRPGMVAAARIAFFVAIALFVYAVAMTTRGNGSSLPQVRGAPKPASAAPMSSAPK
jgi:hypothetical protein